MDEYLIVDGYNIINDWASFRLLRQEGFQHARERLVDMLSSYQGYKGIRVIVVFDAHLVKWGTERRYFDGPIELIFSSEGETADTVIERLVYQLVDDANIVVATSDWEEQKIILGKGATRISARELWNELVAVKRLMKKEFSKQPRVDQCNSFEQRIDDEKRKIMESWRREKDNGENKNR